MFAKTYFYDDNRLISFNFKYLISEAETFQFNCEGYLSGDVAVIREIEFFILENDDYKEIIGAKNIEYWFHKLGAYKVLNSAMLERYGTTFNTVKI